MNKFKLGDKVVITAKERPYYFVPIMDKYLNRKLVATIKYVDGSSYQIDKGWWIEEQNLELVQTLTLIKVIIHDNKTILIDNGNKYESTCIPPDTFDLEKGIMLCLLKKYGVSYKDIEGLAKNADFRQDKLLWEEV